MHVQTNDEPERSFVVEDAGVSGLKTGIGNDTPGATLEVSVEGAHGEAGEGCE